MADKVTLARDGAIGPALPVAFAIVAWTAWSAARDASRSSPASMYLLNASRIPSVIGLIFEGAFSMKAAAAAGHEIDLLPPEAESVRLDRLNAES